jgi:Ser/Thr protein kinase RdoA (MazF antagonist)
MKQDGYAPRAQLCDISFLSGHYRLGSVSLVRDLGGAYNLNLLLQTERGKYVLRVYRPWVTQLRLSQLHQVKRFLAHAGFPVPLPLPAISGETILRYHDHLLELEPFIAHDGEADTWERNAIAFSLLGKLHAFLVTEATNIHLIDPVVSNYGTPEMLLAWTRQAAEESSQLLQQVKTQQTRQALSLYTEAIQLLITLQEQWDKTQEHLPRQLTHGDYGGGNLLFLHEQPVAMLDFDFMRIRERVFELAYTLYWWLSKQGQGHIAAVSCWHRVKELLASYNEATFMPLTAQEIRALPLEMARVPLYWIAETHLFPNPTNEVIKHVEKMTDAHWILEHASQLTDLFAQAV